MDGLRRTRLQRLVALAAAAAGCHPPPPVAPVENELTPAALVVAMGAGAWGGWRTLRAEHRVAVEVARDGGVVERHTLRGAVAVERPDRFRLRALGPAGITLFDLLHHDGRTEVIEAIRDPEQQAFARLLSAIGGDLAAAYDLAPRPPERRIRFDGSALLVEEPERTVRLSRFVDAGGKPAPRRIEVENRAARYRVTIDASHTVIDEPLDPALFR